jgi:hypothetical protein
MKNGKLPGTGNILPQNLTLDTGITAQLVKYIFEDIWKNNKISAEWTKGITVELSRKGNLTERNNW